MAEKGYLHSRSKDFGKLPAELMHDKAISDGAKLLYAHMHWRYGNNMKNWESQASMADMLGVSQKTIARRTQELANADWIIVIERGRRSGQYQTNFYHVFELQADCIKWRASHRTPVSDGQQTPMSDGHRIPVSDKPDTDEPDAEKDSCEADAKPNWNEAQTALMETWHLAKGRTLDLLQLLLGTSKKYPNCICPRWLTADELRGFPKWYYSKHGGGMSRDIALPTSPPVFQQHITNYTKWLDTGESRNRGPMARTTPTIFGEGEMWDPPDTGDVYNVNNPSWQLPKPAPQPEDAA